MRTAKTLIRLGGHPFSWFYHVVAQLSSMKLASVYRVVGSSLLCGFCIKQ